MSLFGRDPTTAARIPQAVTDPPPRINVRYFYASELRIDDPLAPVPPPPTGPSTAANLPPLPFSAYDSTSIDNAWNKLRHNIKAYEEKELEKTRKEQSRATTPYSSPQWQIRNDGRWGSAVRDISVGQRLGKSLTEARRDRSARGSYSSPKDEPLALSALRAHDRTAGVRERSSSAAEEPLDALTGANTSQGAFDIGETDQGTTGRPFIRAPARSNRVSGSWDDNGDSYGAHTPRSPQSRRGSASEGPAATNKPSSRPSIKLPVGVSRLHQVAMPELQMEPIYWSPVHDIAEVIRATWFYKDTMLPVEVDVANLLEAGYISLRPWTTTWKDELNSAINVGALGEERIAHALWPAPPLKKPSSRPGTSTSASAKEAEDSPEAARARTLVVAGELIEASTILSDYDNKASGTNPYGNDGQVKSYKQSRIIYANEREAFILRPSLQPSAYYGRRPLANYIRKGHRIGICVVRGFDQGSWNILHPGKHGTATQSAKSHTDTPHSGGFHVSPSLNLPQADRYRVTDLILVIHGIGQKLSERMESYHFTHAINTFRRESNVQLDDPAVKPHLRKDMGKTMVLPVNWRSTLSFEDGGYREGLGDSSDNQYTLKDITPESLPGIRSMISDVMLDIPYYLSHHQPRMISAVITEANRIHDLWCMNNPDFGRYGRVHLLAHSLGSVMALDILSKQPTRIRPTTPKEFSEPTHFSFNTTNLYQCGSPAGFFLLLQKAGLRPRRERELASTNASDSALGVSGEEGDYGCIAVENIYNVVNPYDPVAYRINAAIDSAYAASLKPAIIPTASSSWFSFGSPLKSGYSRTAASTAATSSRPNMTQRLPSNVELETHDFSREEIAEKRAYLLNDNGQVDYFLRYGGGPLEIQYLTMLGAHSSYWLSRDFIRFLVVETGREPGREGALEGLRPVKKKKGGT